MVVGGEVDGAKGDIPQEGGPGALGGGVQGEGGTLKMLPVQGTSLHREAPV